MSDKNWERSKLDVAYACFIPPAVLCLIVAITSEIPMNSGTAGGIGFLVLIPLTMVSVATIAIGVVLTIANRMNIILLVLSITTILMVAILLFKADSPSSSYNALLKGYSIIVLILEGLWFFFRRCRIPRN